MADAEAPNSTVYVNRLPPSGVTEEELITLFSDCGTVESVRFAGGRFRRLGGGSTTSTSRYAFVKFSHPDEAAHAIQYDKQLSLHDSVLDVELATPMVSRPRTRRPRNPPRTENGDGYPGQGQAQGGYQADNGGGDSSSLKSVQQQLSRLQRQEALLTKYYKEQQQFFISQIAALKKHVASMRQDEEHSGEDSHPPGQFQEGGAGEYN